MGQIVGGAAKPKRCNLNKLSQLGTPAAGEYILVSSDNSMNAAGQGNFDSYIMGDGVKAATALPLIKTYANDVDDVPTAGSENLVKSGGVYQELAPITNAIDDLGWEYVFAFDKAKPSYATLNTPIRLSQEGDSIEFYVMNVPSNQSLMGGGYAFAGKNAASNGNIAVSYIGTVYVRADDGNWIFQYTQGASRSTRRVKIVYNASTIDLYVDGSLVSTYEGVKALTIYGFGNANNTSSYGYWSGKIKELKVNGADVYLSSIATLTNVVVEGNHSFLSPSDLEDSLESTSTSKALSANQGNVLKGLIDDAEEDITALEGSVTGIEETAFGEVDDTTTTNIDEVPGVVKMAGYNAGPNAATEVLFPALSGYDSYYFYPSSALSAWLTDPGVSYIAISIVENAQPFNINAIQGTSVYRKRKSEGNLPSESSPLSIPKGSAVIVTVSAGMVVGFSNKIKKTTFNGETPLAQEHIEQVINAIEDEGGGLEMYVSKTATQLDVYQRNANGKYIRYPFVKRYKAFTTGEYPSFYDNWGIGVPALAEFSGAMADVAPLFLAGEAELAVSVPSGNDGETPTYVGGQAHGFENIVTGSNGREICILVDNQKVAEDAVLSLTPASKVDIIQHTQICQAYTNTNPFADVTKHWVWENGKMSCTTSTTILRSILFSYAQFGMMCVYRRWLGSTSNDYLTNAAIKNNLPYKIWDVSDGWSGMLQSPDKNCTRIVEYGQKGLGFSMSIQSQTTKESGGMFMATNGLAYNKIYFDMGRSFTPSVNDVLEATQIWEIF